MTETPVELRDGSKIEWCDYTFNPWIGCARVSPGCQHCYAETMAGRYGWAEWGKNGTRRVTADSNWKKPMTWQRRAVRDGVRRRVFCASLADVFEDRADVIEPRQRLFDLMAATPDLDWLLLTKRPENVRRMVPGPWIHGYSLSAVEGQPALAGIPQWPTNVWVGTTVEDQERAELRIPELVRIPAPVLFLSCEPLLGPLDLGRWLGLGYAGLVSPEVSIRPAIGWVIAGGESGHGARPMQPEWAVTLRDQATAGGVPFLFKQWGDWGPDPEPERRAVTLDGMYHVGKHVAGRLLEGRTWDELPERTLV